MVLPNNLQQFGFWCQKVLPLVYDDSLSYYEVLCKLTVYINKMIENQEAMSGQITINQKDITELKKQVALVQSELDKVKNGDYVSLYIEALAKWIDSNFQTLVSRMVKYVFFGLTGDGHFAAYVPPAWDFIGWDTIMEPDNPLYGHLVMYW